MWNVISGERAAAVALVGVLVLGSGSAAAGAPRQSPVHALLDVPYVVQTPELCGGAAVAMVLRYWGERGVFAQDFVHLVREDAGGIVTGTLATAVRNRGWQAIVLTAADGSARTALRAEIDRGRPIIALIEVAPLVYHYVVIVGSTDQDVVLHDPARAPYRVLRWVEFERAWAATRQWMMLVLPPDTPRPAHPVAKAEPSASAVVTHVAETPCGAIVERNVQLALTGDMAGADQGLLVATTLCPNDAAPWRELAGVRFSQSRWPESLALALVAVRLAPDDVYAWHLVATSRYLTGDVPGALDAWNHGGEPRIDAIDVHGAGRTRHPVVVRAVGLQPGQLLTPEAYGRALRRLRDVPVASSARLAYEPVEGGLARVDVFIGQRKALPSGWLSFGIIGAKALLRHEVRVDVAGVLGGGELASATWRWAHERPRVALALALPAPQWLPGVVSIDGSWERQSYEVTPSADAGTQVRETRRRAGLRLADWGTSWLRWQAGAAVDRLREHDDLARDDCPPRDYVALDAAVDVRLARDRLGLVVAGSRWEPFAGGSPFMTGLLQATWRSATDTNRPTTSAVAQYAVSSRAAPLALWQGAGTGQGRSALLRAHPLLSGGVVTGPVFGSKVAHVSCEHERPVRRTRIGSLGIAGFVDAAQASHRLNGLGTSPLYVDVGVGLRVHAPGLGGAIRLDVARGLRGGGTTLSASWGSSGRW